MPRKSKGTVALKKLRRRRGAAAPSDRRHAALLIAAAITFMAITVVAKWSRIARRQPDPTEAVTAVNDVVRLPLSALVGGTARFYHIDLQDETRVRFFAVRHPVDAAIHVALDAGQNSFEVGMGYRQDGSDMICRGCGARIPIARLDGPVDGCTPIPISHDTEGDQLVLRENDLTKYAGLFRLRR